MKKPAERCVVKLNATIDAGCLRRNSAPGFTPKNTNRN